MHNICNDSFFFGAEQHQHVALCVCLCFVVYDWLRGGFLAGSLILTANKTARMSPSRPIRSLEDILLGSLTLTASDPLQMCPSTHYAPHSTICLIRIFRQDAVSIYGFVRWLFSFVCCVCVQKNLRPLLSNVGGLDLVFGLFSQI